VQSWCNRQPHPTRCLAIFTSLYLTDVLSRIPILWDAFSCRGALPEGGDDQRPVDPLDCKVASDPNGTYGIRIAPSDLPQYTGVALYYYRHQYAYSIRGFAETLALIVLLLHFVLVVAHLLEHYWWQQTYALDGWSNVGELVASVLGEPGSAQSASSSWSCSEVQSRAVWKLRLHTTHAEGATAAAHQPEKLDRVPST